MPVLPSAHQPSAHLPPNQLASLLERLDSEIYASANEEAAAIKDSKDAAENARRYYQPKRRDPVPEPPSPPSLSSPSSRSPQESTTSHNNRMASMELELAASLSETKSHLLANEQLEDWLRKALTEIDDLRNDLSLAKTTPKSPANQSMSDVGRDLLRMARSPAAKSPSSHRTPLHPPISTTSPSPPSPHSPSDPPPHHNPSWPSANNSSFNHLRLGSTATRNILGMLRRTSTTMERMARNYHTDDLFSDDIPAPSTPGAPTFESYSANIDLESEVATFVDAMQCTMQAKCDELESLKEFVKYLEKYVLY